MKKRLISLIAVLSIFLTFCLPAQASEESNSLAKMDEIIQFIKDYGLEYSDDRDVLREGLETLFEKDPESFDKLMDAILSNYDSHSMYVPSGDYDTAFSENDSYVGIGITLKSVGDVVRISEVRTGGPAEKVGLLPGDILTHVEGQALSSSDLTSITSLIRGAEGTSVTITVKRGTLELTFTVKRGAIVIPNISGYVMESGIYYMDINKFSDVNNYILFYQAMQEMLKEKSKVLILDLRGDPGGQIDMVLNFINSLIPDKGLDFFSIATRNESNNYDVLTYRSVGAGPRLNKIIILTDNNSASASEIMTSSLHDLGYAITVGETTFGKARGQYHLVFDDNSAAVLTTIKLIPPSGTDYEGVGLAPDYQVENYTAPHPAASCRRLDFKYLAINDKTQNTLDLRDALKAMGYLDSSCVTTYFDREMLDAVNAFRKDMGLDTMTYVNAQTINMINTTLDSLSQYTVTVDAQLEKALELARKYSKLPIQYELDESGNLVNID
ncbi:MAG: S41 family peptidase [Clostridiaceae bacterium]|nr:S41 family peptidase [Clostridiaceae bacterium]